MIELSFVLVNYPFKLYMDSYLKIENKKEVFRSHASLEHSIFDLLL